MSPHPTVPFLNLGELNEASKEPVARRSRKYYHLFGIFLYEEQVSTAGSKISLSWWLADETCPKGIKIKLLDEPSTYPKPIHGDIVRVHRATFDYNTRMGVIVASKNVVLWHGFVYNPTPISNAINPTITQDDTDRRRQLESFQCSTVTKIDELRIQFDLKKFDSLLDVAGRVDEKSFDKFGHIILKLTDDTGSAHVRIFSNQKPDDCSTHFENASKLNIGNIAIAFSLKLDPKVTSPPYRLNLSANTICGRAIRFVEPTSILGTILIEKLHQDAEAVPSVASQNSLPIQMPRRSPRLNPQGISQQSLLAPVAEESRALAQTTTPPPPSPPPYTKLSDINNSGRGFYTFHDVAGQVRGKPHEVGDFGNWLFQIFDGSRPQHPSYYADQLLQAIEDCVTILVYSKQKPTDTEEHINKIKTLNEGDLVLVKNVKVSFRDGKMKLEMSANLDHGKSINVIDQGTRLGQILFETVTNPIVDELNEEGTFSDLSDEELEIA